MVFNKKHLFLTGLFLIASVNAGIITIDNQTPEALNISTIYQGKGTQKNNWQFTVFQIAAGIATDIDYANNAPLKISIAHPNYFIGEIIDPQAFTKNASLTIRQPEVGKYTAEWKMK